MRLVNNYNSYLAIPIMLYYCLYRVFCNFWILHLLKHWQWTLQTLLILYGPHIMYVISIKYSSLICEINIIHIWSLIMLDSLRNGSYCIDSYVSIFGFHLLHSHVHTYVHTYVIFCLFVLFNFAEYISDNGTYARSTTWR